MVEKSERERRATEKKSNGSDIRKSDVESMIGSSGGGERRSTMINDS